MKQPLFPLWDIKGSNRAVTGRMDCLSALTTGLALNDAKPMHLHISVLVACVTSLRIFGLEMVWHWKNTLGLDDLDTLCYSNVLLFLLKNGDGVFVKIPWTQCPERNALSSATRFETKGMVMPSEKSHKHHCIHLFLSCWRLHAHKEPNQRKTLLLVRSKPSFYLDIIINKFHLFLLKKRKKSAKAVLILFSVSSLFTHYGLTFVLRLSDAVQNDL